MGAHGLRCARPCLVRWFDEVQRCQRKPSPQVDTATETCRSQREPVGGELELVLIGSTALQVLVQAALAWAAAHTATLRSWRPRQDVVERAHADALFRIADEQAYVEEPDPEFLRFGWLRSRGPNRLEGRRPPTPARHRPRALGLLPRTRSLGSAQVRRLDEDLADGGRLPAGSSPTAVEPSEGHDEQVQAQPSHGGRPRPVARPRLGVPPSAGRGPRPGVARDFPDVMS